MYYNISRAQKNPKTESWTVIKNREQDKIIITSPSPTDRRAAVVTLGDIIT